MRVGMFLGQALANDPEVTDVVDRAIELAGDEDTVAAGLRRYRDAGVTELMPTMTDLVDAASRARTWAVATQL